MTGPKLAFITGTDTGVGKTTLGCALLAAWRLQGRHVAALKPFETGCATDADGQLIAVDALRLARAAGLPPSAPPPVTYALRLPASPQVAARVEGRSLDLQPVRDAFGALRPGRDLVLVEGAGGLLVPLAPGLTMADLAADLGLPLLIVARTTLGTVNHTLLTIAAARQRGLRIAAVLLNRTTASIGPDEPATPALLAEHGGVPIFGPFPFLGPEEPDPDALAQIAERHLDLNGLWQAL